jgi:hypothetical protein
MLAGFGNPTYSNTFVNVCEPFGMYSNTSSRTILDPKKGNASDIQTLDPLGSKTQRHRSQGNSTNTINAVPRFRVKKILESPFK